LEVIQNANPGPPPPSGIDADIEIFESPTSMLFIGYEVARSENPTVLAVYAVLLSISQEISF
jgi:hypothetical protein